METTAATFSTTNAVRGTVFDFAGEWRYEVEQQMDIGYGMEWRLVADGDYSTQAEAKQGLDAWFAANTEEG